MSESFDLQAPDHFTAGAIGPKGQRVFYLQARQDGMIATFKLEKQQVQVLADYLERMLENLPPTDDTFLTTTEDLLEPVSPEWVIGELGIGYDEDISRARRVLTEVAHDLWDDEDYRGVIIEEPEVTGVEVFGPESVTLRVLLKTAPMDQWGVARALRQRIKARFDHEGIEIPLPQRVVWHREEQAGPSRDGEEPAET